MSAPLRQEWFSAAELAGLPGMPTRVADMSRSASRHGWTTQRRGRIILYSVSSLPPETQAELARRAALAEHPAALTAAYRAGTELAEALRPVASTEVPAPSTAPADSRQSSIARARLEVLRQRDAFAVGERELRKRGIDPEKLTEGKCVRIGADGKGTLGAIPFKGETYEWTSKDGTRRETLPRGVQPGWAYNVGKAGTDIRDRTTEVQRKMENAARPQPPEQPWRERLAEQLKARKNTSQAADKIEKSDGEKVELTGIIEEVARKIPLKKLGFTDTEAVPDNNAIPAAAVGIINARLEAGGFKARVKTIVYNQKKGTTEGSLVVRPPLPDGSEDEVFDTLARTKRIEDTHIDPEHFFETMGDADRVRRVSSIASQKTIQAAFEAAQKGQVTRFIGTNGRRYIEVAIDGLEGKALFLIERDTEDETRIHWFPVSGAGVIVLSAQERKAMLKLKNMSEMFKRRLTNAEIVDIVGNEEMSRDALDELRRKIKQVQDEFI